MKNKKSTEPAIKPAKCPIILIPGLKDKAIPKKGSAIFIHLTANYQPTAGCIALSKKDFLILIKLINKKTKIRILK